MKQIAPKNTRAFSMAEILVAVSILGLVLFTAGPSLRSTSVSTKGTAQVLAAAFTEARQQAIAEGVPVALVIPSGGGTQAQADSYYIASGEEPRVTRVQRLGVEQPGVRLMVGHWPLDAGKLKNPNLSTSISPPVGQAFQNSFEVKNWHLSQAQDYAFVFTPQGRLVTNDLPHFDGAYHVVVSHGGSSTPASADGTPVTTQAPNMFALTKVGSPYTVSLNSAGNVRVTPGLVGAADNAVTQLEQAETSTPPEPPSLDPPSTEAPVVTSVSLLPDPEKLNIPEGADMLIAPGRPLSITVRAKSPERVPLYCQWTADSGGLSADHATRMKYLPESGEWESIWQWIPPETAAPGDQFTLQGKVRDAQRNETVAALGSTDPVIQVGDDSSKVVFQSDRDGNKEIYVMNIDGSGQTRLTKNPGVDDNPVWSPDGTKIAFASNREGNTGIYVMNADGSGQTRLSSDPSGPPVWSPDGTRITFPAMDGDIYAVGADGSGRTNLTNSGARNTVPVWSPDGTQLAFISERDNGLSDIFVMNADGTGQTNLTRQAFNNNYVQDDAPVWSPDGTQIAFGFIGEIYVMNADGTGQTNLTNHPGGGSKCVWSPDGRIAFHSSRHGTWGTFIMNADGSGQTNLFNSLGNDVGPEWSPDGNKIVFLSQRDGNIEIYVMNADSTEQTRLTYELGSDGFHDVR